MLSVALACKNIMRLSSNASTKLHSNSPECTCSQVCNFVCSRRFCHLDVSEAACGSNMHDTVQNYWCFVGARLCLQGAVILYSAGPSDNVWSVLLGSRFISYISNMYMSLPVAFVAL